MREYPQDSGPSLSECPQEIGLAIQLTTFPEQRTSPSWYFPPYLGDRSHRLPNDGFTNVSKRGRMAGWHETVINTANWWLVNLCRAETLSTYAKEIHLIQLREILKLLTRWERISLGGISVRLHFLRRVPREANWLLCNGKLACFRIHIILIFLRFEVACIYCRIILK